MAIALRKHSTLVNDNAPPSRDQVLARYRTLREISKRHHHEILKLISGDALLRQARRLAARSSGRAGLVIRFLSIGPRLCSTLPSDPASRRRPCASLILRHHQAG